MFPGNLDKEKFKESSVLGIKLAAVVAVLAFLYFYQNLVYTLVAGALNTDGSSLRELFSTGLSVAEVVIATQIFLMITSFVIQGYLENRGKKREIHLILSVYSYIVWAFIAVFMVSRFFKDVGALLTSVGLIGFGLTLALQKPILNFVGWLNIVITKPFNTGDRIEVNGIRGDVIAIHTMYTRLQGTRQDSMTKSEQVITLPNEQILTNPVLNFSRIGDLYTDEAVFSISYESNWRKALEIAEAVTYNTIKKYVKSGPASLEEKRSWNEAANLLQAASKRLRRGFVRDSVKEKIEILKSAEASTGVEVPKPRTLMTFGDSSIDIKVLYQTDMNSVRSTKHEINRAFLEAIEKRQDIEMPYPHVQVVSAEKKRVGRGQEKLFKSGEQQEPPGA